MVIKEKRKEGRPPADDTFGKFNQVFEAVPEDGTAIHFSELAKKLYPMSHSTISEALEHGRLIGLLIREYISKKNILYYKATKENKQGVESKESLIRKMTELSLNEVKKGESIISKCSHNTINEVIIDFKKNRMTEAYILTQALAMNKALSRLEHEIMLDLLKCIYVGGFYEYEDDEKDKKNFKHQLFNRIKFIYVPLFKKLFEDAVDIGIHPHAYKAIHGSGRRSLEPEDFGINELPNDVKTILDEARKKLRAALEKDKVDEATKKQREVLKKAKADEIIKKHKAAPKSKYTLPKK